MELGFNQAANDDRGVAVSVDALRGQALKRLNGVQQKLETKGIDHRTARVDPIGDMGLLGTLILGMVAGGPFMAMLHTHFPAVDAFNFASLSPVADGVSFLRDQAVEGYRSRKVNEYYPEGRRHCALEAAKVGKKFNLVSANQNNRLSFDTQADVACMCELLDMLDKLEQEGVKMMRLEQDKPVYDVLKRTTKRMFGNDAIRTHDISMMVAV